jgi:putative flippase GtrA
VDWIDDLDSRVDIIATALADLRGIVRLGSGLARGSIKVPALRDPSLVAPRPVDLPMQIVRFTVIGVLSTIAYVVLYLLLRVMMPAQAANAISLLVTAVANTAANRKLTFGIRGRSNAGRHQIKGLIAFGAGLALTSGALAALGHAGRGAEVAVLIGANLVATVLRFVLYRSWVFGGRHASGAPPARGPSPAGAFDHAVQVTTAKSREMTR